MNRSAQKQLIADLMECECFEDPLLDLPDYDDAIAEINAMIACYINVGNKEEVAAWRRMLQQTKIAKRNARRMIDDQRRLEIAYT